jgi:GTP-binding protein HflX
LTFTAEVSVKRFSQKMERPNPKTFVGTGKIEEIHFVKENEISTYLMMNRHPSKKIYLKS